MKKTLLIVISCLINLTSYAQNNNKEAVGAGGVSFSKISAIRIEREELRIAPNEVHVITVFENTSPQPISTQVFFTVPEFNPKTNFETWDSEINPNLTSSGTPFINFSATVQGQYKKFAEITRATLNNKDITQQLQAANIPLNPAFVAGEVSGTDQQKLNQWQNQARNLGFLDDNNKPRWKKQTLFYWTQTFPPHEAVLIEQKYRPATGFFALVNDQSIDKDPLPPILKKLANTLQGNVIDIANRTELKNWLLQRLNTVTAPNSTYAYVYNVNYNLISGSNWNAPIKNFMVTLVKPTNGLLTYNRFYATDNITKDDSPTALTLYLQNFIPQQDLKVLFLSANPLNLNPSSRS